MSVTVSEKGWVVIPAELRHKCNLRPGAHVNVVDYGGVLALVPAMARPARQAAGMLKGRRSLTRAVLVEHREDATARHPQLGAVLGFTLRDGRFTTIDVPDNILGTHASGIDDRGRIVGIRD
jgi:AbrB family looped-hinge helix DNA binding protein